MPEGRPAIPAELRRAVLLEAGHRCAVPTCRAHPVDIEHIDDWAKVKEHKFGNLIALCPNCHRRKGNGPDQIDRKSLRQYKAKLAVLNSRYGELEQRLIEAIAGPLRASDIRQGPVKVPNVMLPHGSGLSIWNLIQDGYLVQTPRTSTDTPSMVESYQFTQAGAEFLMRWADAQPLDPPPHLAP
ncbi:HNH endonuclease [[Kitasatospora] papulosa]|uniref:HNH endonuclease n=1 Tax=[Kitasatospora] papulosa TaxID=1464011 RepID=UPI00403C38E3